MGPVGPGKLPGPPAAPPGQWPYTSPPPRRNKGTAIAIAAVALVATAALVVGIIALSRSSTSTSTAAANPTTLAPTSAPADTTSANRALCTAIAPLMGDSDRSARAYSDLGPAGTPAWKAGAPTFISETKDWVERIQPVIDSHPLADPFLRRSLQRFVDDRRYLVADLEAGGWQSNDQTNWNDSLSAYNGPLTTCWNLGIKW